MDSSVVSKETNNNLNLTGQKKNPSRVTCEETIKRILMTEVLENGKNTHFRNSTDFMGYFESLYPTGDALTKQVQRAIKALDMPKDENGFYIINKTNAQVEEDRELTHLLKKTQATISSLDECETLFVKADPSYRDYLMKLLSDSETFRDKYTTILPTNNGLIFYTENKAALLVLIESLME